MQAFLGGPAAKAAAAPGRHPDCEADGCADEPFSPPLELCATCLEATAFSLPDLDTSALEAPAAALAGAGVEPFDLADDPGLYLVSFSPSAVAAPAAEISTSAMVTLGLGGLAFAARKMRRVSVKPRPSEKPLPA